MPAAAVIPAPRVYIKVVAVKKLVVGPWRGTRVGPLLPLGEGGIQVDRFFVRPRPSGRGKRFLETRGVRPSGRASVS